MRDHFDSKLMQLNILTNKFCIGIIVKSDLCVYMFKKYINLRTLTNVYVKMEVFISKSALKCPVRADHFDVGFGGDNCDVFLWFLQLV